VAHAKAHAPAFAALLKDVDPATITTREALATLPVTRKSDLAELQKAAALWRPGGGAVGRRLRPGLRLSGADLRAGGRRKDYWRLAGPSTRRDSAVVIWCTTPSRTTSRRPAR
jgi:phenylacetate-CoA ligase